MIAIAWPSTLWPFAFWGGFLELQLNRCSECIRGKHEGGGE